MSCKHPLKAFKLGINPKTGKDLLRIRPYTQESCVNYAGEVITDFVEIPCGQCIDCRLQRAREWANRCQFEQITQEEKGFPAYFITLTYNNAHLPDRLVKCDSDGVVEFESPFHSLNKSHFQMFMKRLRNYFPDYNLRFFGCGEYGEQYYRPHFHLILFGCRFPDNDLHMIKRNMFNQPIFVSDIISACWSEGVQGRSWNTLSEEEKQSLSFGFHSVAYNTWESSCYVARYVTKKQYGLKGDIYDDLAFVPEFSLCSRKPGIGAEYYNLHKDDIYRTDEVFIKRSLGSGSSIRSKPPKYFDKLFDIDNPDDFDIIKETRKRLAEVSKKAKLANSDLDYLSMLLVEEEKLLSKTNVLKERSYEKI